MPLGCEYHYVIFRKDSLQSSKARLECATDGKALAFLNALLAHSHADGHLVALQDEGAGFSSKDLDFWEGPLGLKWNDGYESVDFYIPNIEVPICRWLEFSLVRAIDNGSPRWHTVAWDTYRFVGDESRQVTVDYSGPVQPYVPGNFPVCGEVIDTRRYDDLNFEVIDKKPSWYGNPPKRIS